MIKNKYEKNEIIDFTKMTFNDFVKLSQMAWNEQRKINMELSTEEIIEQMGIANSEKRKRRIHI